MKSLVHLKIPQEMACKAHCLALPGQMLSHINSLQPPVHLTCPKEASWSHLDSVFHSGEQLPLAVVPTSVYWVWSLLLGLH